MTLDKPYFLENKDWYVFNFETNTFELTDEAPKKAIDSYKEFYEKLEGID